MIIENRIEFNQFYEEVFREVRYEARRHRGTCLWYRKETIVVIEVSRFRKKGRLRKRTHWVDIPFDETRRREKMLRNTKQ